MEFSNLEQATAEDCSAVTNLNASNSTLIEKLALYTNRLSTKEANNVALRTSIKNFQGEVKNINA